MKPDWFEVAKLDGLLGVPGVKLGRSGKFEIHRSHLPLLDYVHPKAPKLLTGAETRWVMRDERTEALGFKLRVTQHQALEYFHDRRGILLGDSMRMGKTACGVMAHDPARGPLVVVGPLMSRAVWLSWIQRIFPGVDIGIAIGKTLNPETLKKPIVFIHYDLLRFWQTLMPIGTLVFDEAHALTNDRSKRTHAATLLAGRAAKVLALTGTPIWNMPPNLWSILGLVAPGAWGSLHDFSQRYGAPVPTTHGIDYTGISNGDELNLRLSEVMLRREWRNVSDDIPAISRSVIIADVDEAKKKKLDLVAGALRAERSNTAAHLASYRQAISKFKLEAVVREAKRVSSSEPCVVWTWHVEFAKLIGEKLAENAFVITGEIGATKREEIIEAWKQSTNGVLIATMAVAQVAVDFSHALIAIFAELDYIPAVIAQAEMRTFLPTRAMHVMFVVLDHIIDRRLVIALEKKLSAQSGAGVGTASDAIESLRVAVLGKPDEPDLERFLDDLLAS